MRVTERTARRYLVSDALQGMAEHLALELADEQPGADLLAGPRTIPMSIAVIGRTVAALAEATQVRLASDDTYAADGAAQVISMLGQVLSECPIPPATPASFRRPPLPAAPGYWQPPPTPFARIPAVRRRWTPGNNHGWPRRSNETQPCFANWSTNTGPRSGPVLTAEGRSARPRP